MHVSSNSYVALAAPGVHLTYPTCFPLPCAQHQVLSYLVRDGGSREGKGARSRVNMNGPGGVGRSEVAVARVCKEAPQQVLFPQAPETHHPAQPLTNLVRSSLRVVSKLLGERDVVGRAAASNKLQCGLLSVVLPVDTLARMIASGSLRARGSKTAILVDAG